MDIQRLPSINKQILIMMFVDSGSKNYYAWLENYFQKKEKELKQFRSKILLKKYFENGGRISADGGIYMYDGNFDIEFPEIHIMERIQCINILSFRESGKRLLRETMEKFRNGEIDERGKANKPQRR